MKKTKSYRVKKHKGNRAQKLGSHKAVEEKKMFAGLIPNNLEDYYIDIIQKLKRRGFKIMVEEKINEIEKINKLEPEMFRIEIIKKLKGEEENG